MKNHYNKSEDFENKKSFPLKKFVVISLLIGLAIGTFLFSYKRFQTNQTPQAESRDFTEVPLSTEEASPQDQTDRKEIFDQTRDNSKDRSQDKEKTPITLPSPPTSYTIEGGTHAYQTFNNCGPASLSMTLSFYDIFVGQEELGAELRPYQIPSGNNDDKSVTLPEIAEEAEEYGFTTYHRPNGNMKNVKQFVSNDIPVITRTLLEEGNDIGHYRVIYGYDEDTKEIIQNDSLQGQNLRFTYNDYLTLWKPFSYEYLVLVPEEKVDLAERILDEDLDKEFAWEKTVERLETEVEENPRDVQRKFSLSVAYYNVGEYEKSVETFEAVEDQLPFRQLWYQIEPLKAYQELEMYNELLPRISEILNGGNRAFSELYQIRGEVYLKQGETEKARAEFEKALLYNENFEPAKESLKKL